MKISTLKSLALGLAAVALSLSVASCELLGLLGPDTNKDPGPGPAPAVNEVAVYSETYDNWAGTYGLASYSGGASATWDDTSTAKASDGTKSTAMTVPGGTYAGVLYSYKSIDGGSGPVDVSDYGNYVFSINLGTTTIVHMAIKLEDANGGNHEFDLAGLSAYASTPVNGWTTYTIPMANYSGVDFTKLTTVLFGNPKDSNNTTYSAGTFYVDNVYFSK